MQDSYDFIATRKTIDFQNVVILLKLVFNKDKNNYHYLKCLYK